MVAVLRSRVAEMTSLKSRQPALTSCGQHQNISLRVKCSPKALQHHNSSNNPQDEGLHCSASHTGHGSARLLAQVADTSWNRRRSIDSCCARRASMESAFCASYCVLPGRNESYEGLYSFWY